MARKNAGNRDVTQVDAGDMLGLTKQAVGHWVHRAPAELLVDRDGKRFLKWPDFPRWYHKQLATSTKLQEERLKKLAVERERLELELELRRGSVVLKGHAGDALEAIYWQLRGQLWGQITNYMKRFVMKDRAECIALMEDFGRQLEWAMKNTPLYPREKLLMEAARNPENRPAIAAELAERAVVSSNNGNGKAHADA